MYKQDCTTESISAPLTCCSRIVSLPFIVFLISQQVDVPAIWNTEVTRFVIWWSGKLTPAGQCFSVIKKSKLVLIRTLEDISARKVANTAFYVSSLTGDKRKPDIRGKPVRMRQTQGGMAQERGLEWIWISGVALTSSCEAKDSSLGLDFFLCKGSSKFYVSTESLGNRHCISENKIEKKLYKSIKNEAKGLY